MSAEPAPALAAVARTIEPAARAAARHPPRKAARLPETGEQDTRVPGIERDVGGPGVGVDDEHRRPGPPTVQRAIDAALRIRSEGVPEEGREGDLRIGGMDDDLADLPLLVEHMEPALAGVDRLVDAVTGLNIAANVGLARADIDHIRVRRRDGDRARRKQRLPVEDRFPLAATVSRLPDATLRRRRVVGERIAGDTRDPGYPPADGRADRAELEEIELAGGAGGPGRKRQPHHDHAQEAPEIQLLIPNPCIVRNSPERLRLHDTTPRERRSNPTLV